MGDDIDKSESRSGQVAAQEITQLLAEARYGDRSALYELIQVVSGELRRMVYRYRQAWRSNEIKSTTAVVHEAYLKLTWRGELPRGDQRQVSPPPPSPQDIS